jgi:DNA-directed RNA polymerase subunit F
MLKDVMTDIDPDRIQLTQEDERDPEFLKQLAQLDPDAVESTKSL